MLIFLIQFGIEFFFEEYGLMVLNVLVYVLVIMLRCDVFILKMILEKRCEFDQEEDNYWFLNGDMFVVEEVRWDYLRSGGFFGFGIVN